MTEPRLHPTAVVSPGADLDASVVVGPFAVIGRDKVLDPVVVVGGPPQHTRFDGRETWVELGDRNVLREGATIHRAYAEGGATRVGSGCYLMNNTHVGHDCVVGDDVVLTSGAVLGGHVEVGAGAVLGGCAGAHQFIRIGAFCRVAAYTALRKDALPFTMIGGTPVRHYRLDRIGLRRRRLDGERYRALEAAFRALRHGDRALDGLPSTDETELLRTWLAARSKYGVYGFARPGRTPAVADASPACLRMRRSLARTRARDRYARGRSASFRQSIHGSCRAGLSRCVGRAGGREGRGGMESAGDGEPAPARARTSPPAYLRRLRAM